MQIKNINRLNLLPSTPPPLSSAAQVACEQALLGKNSEEREGKGGERACRQTFEAAIPPLVIILPIICQ